MDDSLLKEENSWVVMDYPFLYPRDGAGDPIVGTDRCPFDFSFTALDTFDIPEGWRGIVSHFVGELGDIFNEFDAEHQMAFYLKNIYEENGILHIYPSFYTEEVLNLIYKYQDIAKDVCMECGAPAVYREIDTDRRYCDNHIIGKVGVPKDSKL